jgi:hypothetical protein
MIMTSLRILTVIIALTGLIIGSLFISPGNSYGKDYQKKSLAVSQANYCGQGEVGMSVQCTNTLSQTQGNENGVAVTD